jgi:peptidoglycan/LPS O-acetylase OafA/YrhL
MRREEPRRFYLPQLDGLRFVAFLAVFVFHFLQSARRPLSSSLIAVAEAGAFGVDLFFILSSFLITSLLLREQASEGQIHVRAFWVRRALRIWPLYFLFVGVFLLLNRPPGWYALGLLTFTTNWALLHRWYPSPMNHLWSVAIEEQFYLCWPLILALLGARWLPAVSAAMIGGALVARAWLLASRATLTDQALWIHTLDRLEPLALGILIAWFWPRIAPTPRLPAWSGLASVGAAWALVAIIIGYCVTPGTLLVSPPIWTYTLVDVILAGSLGITVWAASCLLAHPILIYLGRISYGLYVFHFPVIYGVREGFGLRWPLRLLLTLGLTVALAAYSYRFLEQPFLRLKQRFTYVRSAPFP